jgi:hypothetical protein
VPALRMADSLEQACGRVNAFTAVHRFLDMGHAVDGVAGDGAPLRAALPVENNTSVVIWLLNKGANVFLPAPEGQPTLLDMAFDVTTPENTQYAVLQHLRTKVSPEEWRALQRRATEATAARIQYERQVGCTRPRAASPEAAAFVLANATLTPVREEE